MSTIAEIAQALQISSASVSRALNGQSGVSDELRTKILAEASRRNFVPHSNARALATTRTETICFAVAKGPEFLAEDPFYSKIMGGIEQELRLHGYHLIVTTLDEAQVAHPEQWSVLQSRRADGVILAGPFFPARFILSVHTQGMPVVLVDNSISHTPIDVVLADDREGARQAAQHILWHGHRRIVILSGPDEWYTNRERCAGFVEALHAQGLEPLAILHADATTYDTGYFLMQEALNHQPTAVLAINDIMAIGAIDAAQAAGISTPEKLAVTGFDDVEAAQFARVPLTTLEIPKQQIGRIAARQLLARLSDPEAPQQRVIASTSLIVRESCGCKPTIK